MSAKDQADKLIEGESDEVDEDNLEDTWQWSVYLSNKRFLYILIKPLS